MTINLAYLYQLISYTDIQISQNLISAAHQIQFQIRTNNTMKVWKLLRRLCVASHTRTKWSMIAESMVLLCFSISIFFPQKLYSNELCVRHCHRFSPIYARVCAVLCLCVYMCVYRLATTRNNSFQSFNRWQTQWFEKWKIKTK